MYKRRKFSKTMTRQDIQKLYYEKAKWARLSQPQYIVEDVNQSESNDSSASMPSSDDQQITQRPSTGSLKGVMKW